MDKNEEDKNIYAKLRELRRARGLTVNTLAEKMGENYQKVGRVERGARSLTVDYLMKIARALETPMESLFAGEKKENNSENKKDSSFPDILNKVVISVEEYRDSDPSSLTAHQKGKMISKIYELTLKFPQEYQDLFLNSLFEFLKSNSRPEEIVLK